MNSRIVESSIEDDWKRLLVLPLGLVTRKSCIRAFDVFSATLIERTDKGAEC